MLWGRKAKTPEVPREITPEILKVIPIKPDNVEVREDSRGMIHLRVTLEPKGLQKRIGKLLKQDYSRKYELDEFGTYFYRQVDGHASLRTIVKRMATHFKRTHEETQNAVVLFTKTLMMKQMLALKLPRGANGKETAE